MPNHLDPDEDERFEEPSSILHDRVAQVEAGPSTNSGVPKERGPWQVYNLLTLGTLLNLFTLCEMC